MQLENIIEGNDKMAGWKYHLNIKDLTKEYDDKEDNFSSLKEEGELLQSIGKRVAKRIRKLSWLIVHNFSLTEMERDSLKNDLEELAVQFDEVYDKDDFNLILEDLYDLGDHNKMIWVNNITIHDSPTL